MKQSVAKAWTLALRSGDYTQTRRKLASKGHSSTSHCCLGVLCEIAIEQGAEVSKIMTPGSRGNWERPVAYNGEVTVPPEAVNIWAGADARRDDWDYLSAMNDDGHSFHEIADYIDTNWEEL